MAIFLGDIHPCLVSVRGMIARKRKMQISWELYLMNRTLVHTEQSPPCRAGEDR